MWWHRIFLLIFTFAIVLSLSISSQATDGLDIASNLAGQYKLEGTNPNGGQYQGTAEITENGETYQIRWKIGPNETYKGIGILQEDVLAVSFESGQVSGVVVYQIQEKPKLVGQWALMGDRKIQAETLTKQKP